MAELSEQDIARMTTPAWERAKQAIRDGRPDDAVALIDEAAERWRSLKDYSINWITSLLTFVAREMGEDAVERSLRQTGEEYVKPRRDTGVEWSSLPASARAKIIARAMVANFGTCEVEEDDEKITLSFRCGSGGRLIDDGRYDGPDGYAVLRERGGRTFMRDELPVYCAHCSVNNEMQEIEWSGFPISVEHPPRHKGETCIHFVYKDPAATPAEAYRRVGKEKPEQPEKPAS